MADNDLEDGELSVSEPNNLNSGIDSHKPGNSSVPESSARKKSTKKEIQDKKTKANGKSIETMPKDMLLGNRKGQLDSIKDKEDRKGNINKTETPAFYSANYKKVPCEFLKKGACTRGDQCTFSHDFEPAKSSTICRFFLGNACDKGDNCPFSHEIDSYPCKFYFARQCDKHTLCPFSHEDHRFFKGEKETNQFIEENSDFMQESLRMNGNAGKLTQKYLYYLDQRRQKNAAIEAEKQQSFLLPSSLGGSALQNSNNTQDFVENRLKFGQIQYQSSNQNQSSQQPRFIDNSIPDNLSKYNNIPNNSHSAGYQGQNAGNPLNNNLTDPRAQMMQRPPIEKYQPTNQPFSQSSNYNNLQPPSSNISSGLANPPPPGMYPHGQQYPPNKEFNGQNNSFKQNPIKTPNYQGQYDANANYPSQGQKPLLPNPSQYNHPVNPQRYLSQQPISHQTQQTPQSSNIPGQYQPIHHYPSSQQQSQLSQQQAPIGKVNPNIPQQNNSGGFQQSYGNSYGNNVFSKEVNNPQQANGQQYQGKPPIIQGIQGGSGQTRIQPQSAPPGNMYLGQLPQGYNQQQPQMKQQPSSHMTQINNSGSAIRQGSLGNPSVSKGPQYQYGENSNSFPPSTEQINPPSQKISEFYQSSQNSSQSTSAQSIPSQVPYPSNSSQYSSYSQAQDQKNIPPPPRNAPLPPPGSLNIPQKLTIPTLNINKNGSQQQQSFNGDNHQQGGGSSGQFASNILPPSVKSSKISDQYNNMKSEKQDSNIQKELQNLPPLASVDTKVSSQGSKNQKQNISSPTVPTGRKVSNQKEGNASFAQETTINTSDSQNKKKLEGIEIQNQINASKAPSSQKKTPSKELGSSQKDKKEGKSSLKKSQKKETGDSESLKQKEASNDDKQTANIVFKDPRQLRKLQEQMKKESAKGLADVQFNLLERIEEEEESKNMAQKLLGKRKQQYDSGLKTNNTSDSSFQYEGDFNNDSGVKKFIAEKDNQKDILFVRQFSDKKGQILKKNEEKDEPTMLIDRLRQLMMNQKKIPKPANKLEEAERKKNKLDYLKACLVKANSQLLIS